MPITAPISIRRDHHRYTSVVVLRTKDGPVSQKMLHATLKQAEDRIGITASYLKKCGQRDSIDGCFVLGPATDPRQWPVPV